MTTQADIKLVIDQLNNLEVVHDYDENVTDGAAQMLETLGNELDRVTKCAQHSQGLYERERDKYDQLSNQVAKQAARIEQLESSPTIEACRQMIESKCAIENAGLYKKIAAQAAVIEKLRDVIEFIRPAAEITNEELEVIDVALSIPTDSTQILQEWLDAKLGEPMVYAFEDGSMIVERDMEFVADKTGQRVDPLFKKPEILK